MGREPAGQHQETIMISEPSMQSAKDFLIAVYEREHKSKPDDKELVEWCLMHWARRRDATKTSGANLLDSLTRERFTK